MPNTHGQLGPLRRYASTGNDRTLPKGDEELASGNKLPTITGEQAKITGDIVPLGLQSEIHIGSEIYDRVSCHNMDIDRTIRLIEHR